MWFCRAIRGGNREEREDYIEGRETPCDNHNLEHRRWLKEFQKATFNQGVKEFDNGIGNSLVYLAPKSDVKDFSTLTKTPAPLRNRVTLTARAMDEIAHFQATRSLNSE